MNRRIIAAAMLALAQIGATAAETSRQLSIAAGKVDEVCLPLRAGQTLHWRFDADAALDFNLHHHLGKQVLMPVERRAVRADEGRHRIDQDNDWCLMWTAAKDRGARVRVSWRVD
jgi:hypothetical protein